MLPRAQQPPHWWWPKAILHPTESSSVQDVALTWVLLGEGGVGSVSTSLTQKEESAIFKKERSSLPI